MVLEKIGFLIMKKCQSSMIGMMNKIKKEIGK